MSTCKVCKVGPHPYQISAIIIAPQDSVFSEAEPITAESDGILGALSSEKASKKVRYAVT